MSATVRIHTTGPSSCEAVRRALAGAAVEPRNAPDSTLDVTGPMDLSTLAGMVAAALDVVALAARGALVPERVSASEFNLRPAAA
jgi:hypothetical protein